MSRVSEGGVSPYPWFFSHKLQEKSFFFLPYDSYHRPSTEALRREEQRGSTIIISCSAPPTPPDPTPSPATAHRPESTPFYCRFITTPSTIPPLGSASLQLPQPPQRPILPHHRQRHAIIPKSHCQGVRSHEGGQTSETYCSLRPGTSSDEAIVL